MRIAVSVIFFFAVNMAVAAPKVEVPKATIAFDEFPTELKITGDQPAARILRALLAQPLFLSTKGGGFEHILTDGMSHNPERGLLSVRLKRNVRFSNGAPIRVLDILTSFRRCGGIPFESRLSLLSEEYQEIWIDFRYDSASKYQPLIDKISACPVFESRSAELFGDSFGLGSNFLAAGEFFIADFKAGVSYSLRRAPIHVERRGVRDLEIVGTQDADASLASLRRGAVGALITTSASATNSASQDTTLQVSQCYGKTLIKRATFQFACPAHFELRNVGYAS